MKMMRDLEICLTARYTSAPKVNSWKGHYINSLLTSNVIYLTGNVRAT